MEKRIHSEYSVYDFMALVIVVSFLGFCLENIWMLFRFGEIDNRNMNFPFLIGYGFAVLFIYMVLGVPQKNNLGPFFIACFFIVSVGEILLGYAVEKFCGIYYWDYTDLPMHLTRYTSFFTSIGFSAVITIFFYRFFTPLMNYFKLHENNKVHVVCVALLAVLVMDLFFSFGYMHSNRATNLSWVLHFPAKGSGLDLEIIPKVQQRGLMIVSFLWYFMIYSFLGWVTEVVFHAVVKGRIINRGFLNGPLCPVYGAGMCAVLWISSVLKAEDPLILFLVGMVFATLIELTAGFILDRLFHARWWDYSSMPLNLHGYICAAFSILWGLAVVAAVKGIHPWIRTIVGLIPDTLSMILLGLLCICITADTAVTALTIIGLNKKLKELDSISRAMRTISDRMTDIIGNNAMKNAQDIGEARVQVALGKAELRDDAGEKLKKLEKRSEEIRLSILAHKHSGAARLLNAFPTMIHKEHQEIIVTLKNRISGK